MKELKLIEIYNNTLEDSLKKFELSSFKNLNNIDINNLKKLFEFFFNELSEEEIDKEGNITEKGILLDRIAGKINEAIISKK